MAKELRRKEWTVTKMVVVETDTGVEPFPSGTHLEITAQDEKGEEKLWTIMNAEGHPVSLSLVERIR